MNPCAGPEKEVPLKLTADRFGSFGNVRNNPRPERAGSYIRVSARTLLWVVLACLPGLVLGVVAYRWAVSPLEQSLMDVEARSMAREIDSAIAARTATIRLAAGSLHIDRLAETGQLDNLLKTTRKAFSDFVSMEIMDEHGEVLALVGELPLSKARRGMKRSKAAKVGTMSYRDTDLFTDDPESSSFLITLKHDGTDGKTWFSRTRFARDSIKQALSTKSAGFVAAVIPADEASQRNSGSKTVFSTWFGEESGKDFGLQTPGWMLSLNQASKGASWKYPSAVAGSLVLLVLALIGVIRRFTSREQGGTTTAASIHESPRPVVDAPPAVKTIPEPPREPEIPAPVAQLETADEEDNDDRWTVHNIPLGIGTQDEPEPVIAAAEGIDAPVQDADWEPDTDPLSLVPAATETEQAPEELPEPVVEADLPEAECVATIEAVPEDGIPEILELTWFEPGREEPVSVPTVPHTCAAERHDTTWTEVPEFMEVTWTEPSRGDMGAEDPDDSEYERLFFQSPFNPR